MIAISLVKVMITLCAIIAIVTGQPMRRSNDEDSFLPVFFKPFGAPVNQARKFLGTFGNFFVPATTYASHREELNPKPERVLYSNNENRYLTTTLTPTTKTQLRNENHEVTTNKNDIEAVKIDQYILDQIFKEIDKNSITSTEDISTNYTTETGEVETTTDYLLRIPAPVLATLLGG